jgi:mRNA-degrading endonuclease RelE of RelBE toxin-antitoxin system
MSYRVEYGPGFDRDVRGIPERDLVRILDAADHHAETAQGDVQHMVGTQGQYRLRVGSYRVIFELMGETLTVSGPSLVRQHGRFCRTCDFTWQSQRVRFRS